MIILIWLVSLGLLCGPVLFFVLAFAYTPEKVVELEGKAYVAVVKSYLHVDVFYYDYYGQFFIGTKLRVHGDFGSGKFNPILEEELASKIVYTFYDEDGNVEDTLVKKEEKYLVKQEDEEEKKPEIVKPTEEEVLLPQAAEVLYEIKFDNVIKRFVVVNYALGQNYLVMVIESKDGGKTFNWKTKDFIQVSGKPRFIFLDENIGFAINTGKVYLDGSKPDIYVTNDGGETLEKSKFIYNTDRNDILDIDGLSYMEDSKLKIKCLEYINKYDHKELIFVSKDKGKTWELKKWRLFKQ